MKSDNFINKKNTIQANAAQIKAMNGKLSQDQQRTKYLLEKATRIDEIDVQNTEKAFNSSLGDAILNYMKTLLYEPDAHDSAILFRTFSLWFANPAHEDALKTLNFYFPQFASHKFIPMIPQIATRLSTDKDRFSSIIDALVGRFK